MAVADKEYIGVQCKSLNDQYGSLSKRIRGRPENLKRRLKQFNEISSCFRRWRELHGICFHDFANILQAAL